ncbi:hypothetical protein IGI67_002876 [Enterococcus sp. AZ196]
MNLLTILSFRKMKSSITQIFGMGLLIAIAAMFFTTLFTFKAIYEKEMTTFFRQQNYADVTLTGNFSNASKAKLENETILSTIEGRTVQDFRSGEKTVRLISLSPKLNQVLLEKGRLPKTTSECVLISQYARKNRVKLKDSLIVDQQKLTVVGIVRSPEYVYYSQNERSFSANPKKFAVAYVVKDFFPFTNQLLLASPEKIKEEKLKNLLDYQSFIYQKDQINYQMYEGDLEQFVSFACIFPTIFWLLSFGIIFIILRRTLLKEHKQIGILKALGTSNRSIVTIYIRQFVLLGFFSSLIGCFLSYPITELLFQVFSTMIELPTLTYHFELRYWIITILVSTVGCSLFSLSSMLDILKEFPAVSMSQRIPKTKKRESHSQLLHSFSFNTRYAFATSLRNKGRFLLMVLGMAASTGLLLFSLGFNDSIGSVADNYFNTFADYDLVVQLPQPAALDQKLLQDISAIDKQDPMLQLSGKIKNEDYPLIIMNASVSTLSLPNKKLDQGLVIPDYYAKKWQVTVGDRITINDHQAIISAVLPLSMGLAIYTSYDYAGSLFTELPKICNTVYLTSKQPDKVKHQLNKRGLFYTTAEEDRQSFHSLLENMKILIFLLVTCSVILGGTVIFCLNLMNLTIREFEYMFMNIMGYSKRLILQAINKENLLQLLLAIPLGFFLGLQLLEAIKDQFSQNSFAMQPEIQPESFIITALIVTFISSLRLMISNRYIDRLNIVEGLKMQEE